jgi:hypothetical protein
MEKDSELLEFFGRECSHCVTMEPLVARLEEEEGVLLDKREVWHSEQNATFMRELDQGRCGGVPFFYNRKTGKWLCGEATYEQLKEWAEGK